MIKMIPVSSKAISAIGYDEKTKKLKIKFKQSKTYDYCNVPNETFTKLKLSISKGTYYNHHIKDKYPCY